MASPLPSSPTNAGMTTKITITPGSGNSAPVASISPSPFLQCTLDAPNSFTPLQPPPPRAAGAHVNASITDVDQTIVGWKLLFFHAPTTVDKYQAGSEYTTLTAPSPFALYAQVTHARAFVKTAKDAAIVSHAALNTL